MCKVQKSMLQRNRSFSHRKQVQSLTAIYIHKLSK
ncbi:unnamed protein product [Schistosoma margrebowiei]|uniref:Uncharacterized protein n=1 Tax=Schistosoma margrebowiei TaxID=48269 RepID=A0A183LDE6_9TREM|nr:unnamed protein product [Schistosoma margrebowiei]